MPQAAGWKHTEEAKQRMKASRARYRTTFSTEAMNAGVAAARLANIGVSRGMKYKTPEERVYYVWVNGNFAKRGWSLTLEQASHLMKQPCSYCGVQPYQQIDSGRTLVWRSFRYQGIDRIDSAEGYHISNCVPCCGVCNAMKTDLSQSTFLSQVLKIAQFKKEGK